MRIAKTLSFLPLLFASVNHHKNVNGSPFHAPNIRN